MERAYNSIFALAILTILASGCTGCIPETTKAVELNEKGEETTIRPKYLSAEQAFALSERLKLRGVSAEIVGLLRFTHFYKRGQREAALVAMERLSHKLARAAAASAKDRRNLESQVVDVDVDEALELRRELESSTECQREVASGRFVPLSGKDFCVVWDSGILDLLPTPGSVITRAARVAAVRSLSKLPRERLSKFPRTAAVMTRYASKRLFHQQEIAAHLQHEENLETQLLDLTWNVTTGLSSPN
jgi:hypothetical protein